MIVTFVVEAIIVMIVVPLVVMNDSIISSNINCSSNFSSHNNCSYIEINCEINK